VVKAWGDGTAVLVPATGVLLGRWNWWPSRMSQAHQHPADLAGQPGGGRMNAAASVNGDHPERLAPADPPGTPE